MPGKRNMGFSEEKNYHNKQFRQKLLGLGLIVKPNGCQSYMPPPTPFFDLLSEYNIDIPQVGAVGGNAAPEIKLPGQSKLKKWSCDCTNVRCAVELHAKCLRCGKIFVLASRPYSPPSTTNEFSLETLTSRASVIVNAIIALYVAIWSLS